MNDASNLPQAGYPVNDWLRSAGISRTTLYALPSDCAPSPPSDLVCLSRCARGVVQEER